MDQIDVPKPKGVRDPDRPAGTLLLAQVRHLHEAEKSLPPKYQSGIFHKAVVTEDDAARYIHAVTKAIHKAHDDAAKERARRRATSKQVIEIAAHGRPPRHKEATIRKQASEDKGEQGKEERTQKIDRRRRHALVRIRGRVTVDIGSGSAGSSREPAACRTAARRRTCKRRLQSQPKVHSHVR